MIAPRALLFYKHLIQCLQLGMMSRTCSPDRVADRGVRRAGNRQAHVEDWQRGTRGRVSMADVCQRPKLSFPGCCCSDRLHHAPGCQKSSTSKIDPVRCPDHVLYLMLCHWLSQPLQYVKPKTLYQFDHFQSKLRKQ